MRELHYICGANGLAAIANAFDLTMSLAGFIPGVGWAISSTYFVANVASMAATGKTIGENIFGNDKIEF